MALSGQEEVTDGRPLAQAPYERPLCQAPFARSLAYVSLGCRVNRVETDAIVDKLRGAGFSLTGERDAAVVVINTCAVTGEAESKARKAIRHAASLPKRPLVVATGCLASLHAASVEALGPNVVVEQDKDEVAQRVLDELGLRGADVPEHLTTNAEAVTATGRTRPGIKIQDGCDLRCSYCVVWKARGPSRSVPVDEVVRSVSAACERGATEVMLTGINLGCYRSASSQGAELRLPELLLELLERTDVGRLRLGSIEPQDVDERLVQVMGQSQGRVAPFLHMCLQSGCDATLGRMRRVYSTDLFAQRAAMARAAIPGLVLGTDVIAGFPGEDEQEFSECLAFCEHMSFSRMHVFRFSPRPGTPAASMEGQVDPTLAAARAAQLRQLAARLRHEEATHLVGSEDLVVVQERGRGVSGGLYDAVLDPSHALGSLVRVRVADVREGDVLVCE